MSNWRSAMLLSLGSLGLAVLPWTPAWAGSLSGPILNDGTTAVLEDVIALPATAASRPLARVNVTKEVPDGSGRLFVNDLNGPMYVLDSGVLNTYLDFSVLFSNLKTAPGLSSGFVSFAFDPDFATNGLFYTAHSEFVGGTAANLGPAIPTTIVQHAVVTEFAASVPGANVFAGTTRELMRIESPHRFHNLGELAFNPNAMLGDADFGLLYIGAGDYGSVAVGEPDQLQRLDSPYGTIMRIDPSGGPFMRGGITYDYGIPSSNPFFGDPDPTVLEEIYAYGFRNGHRISWDAGGPDEGPYVSDIGQGNIEELNRLVWGGNYGWPEREGTFALDVTLDPETVFSLPPNDPMFEFLYPVAQYDHDEGLAIAGGFALRGAVNSTLAGQFVFGDVANGRIFYADAASLFGADDGDPATTVQVYELNLEHDGSPTTLLEVVAAELGLGSVDRVDLRFGLDAGDQLYVTTKQDGFVRTLTPVPEPGQILSILAGCIALGWIRTRSDR